MRIKHFLLGLAGVAAIAVSPAAQELRTETLTIRFFQITAEIAQTPAQRAKGLMGRASLPPNHGMLFVFEAPARQCFWMRNTPLPLTIAFVDAKGKITSFADMTPFSDETHCSTVPVPFALEMEQGWFKKRGVLVGDSISLPNFR
jgi:uncharacterized protein